VADDDPERPLLTEMAEKLRQARSASFTDRPDGPAGAETPPPRAPAARPVEPPAPDPLQVALRIDSLERRLFELRAALDDAVAPAAVAGAAGFHPVADDAAAWIAFAAAAMTAYEDATDQAEAADRLLAEYRARRARGGVLNDDA
jgi:hypothetical protein